MGFEIFLFWDDSSGTVLTCNIANSARFVKKFHFVHFLFSILIFVVKCKFVANSGKTSNKQKNARRILTAGNKDLSFQEEYEIIEGKVNIELFYSERGDVVLTNETDVRQFGSVKITDIPLNLPRDKNTVVVSFRCVGNSVRIEATLAYDSRKLERTVIVPDL